jgi:hypothetical protein
MTSAFLGGFDSGGGPATRSSSVESRVGPICQTNDGGHGGLGQQQLSTVTVTVTLKARPPFEEKEAFIGRCYVPIPKGDR